MKKKKQINQSARPKDATYDHVLKYIGVLGSVQGLKMLVQIVRTKLTSILLHSSGVGVSASLTKISEFVYKLTNLGLSFGAVRNLSELFEEGTDEERTHFVRVIRTWAFWTALIGALLCLGLSSLFCEWYFEGDSSYVPAVCLLSIFVFTMPLEAVECSIVKGMRRLKSLAYIETSIVFGTFFITIPLYYFLGVQGIAVSLVLSGIFVVSIHLVVTTKMFPWRIDFFCKKTFIQGLPLLKLGIPYVVAGLANVLSTLLIFHFLESLQVVGESLQVVGLYHQGFLILTISAGVVYSATDSDYFPRLSAANHDTERMNKMANQQMQVNLLLITPMLILMSLFMSRLIYLLSSIEFITVAPMTICAVFYLFFRGMTLPIAYYPLAKGNSLLYMFAEVIYYVAEAALVYFGYIWGSENFNLYFDGIACSGLAGAGLALSLATIFDVLMISTLYRFVYGFRFQRRTLWLFASEFLCLLAVIPFCLKGSMPLMKYSIGFLSLSISLFLAWRLLSRESSFLQRFKHRG